nr:hypothetical protein [Tanacetum cinerariifolium]
TLNPRINSQLRPRWGFDPGKLLYYVPPSINAASVSPEQIPEADGGQEPGQMDEPEPEAEPVQEPELGMIDGETDAKVDTTLTDSENNLEEIEDNGVTELNDQGEVNVNKRAMIIDEQKHLLKTTSPLNLSEMIDSFDNKLDEVTVTVTEEHMGRG